jgi:hypothetical protein
LQKVDNKYVAGNTSPGFVGGGGNEIWTFKAVGAGSGQLVFTYKFVPPLNSFSDVKDLNSYGNRRSWEPDSLTDATLQFQVNA